MAAKGQSSVHLLEKYRGMSFAKRMKKAAMDVSNNGECWWVHNYVYATLNYRPNHSDSGWCGNNQDKKGKKRRR